MTSTLRNLSLALLAAVSLNATAAPAEAPLPPKVFNDASVTMQSRVCGELLTGLALGGVQALKLQFPTGTVPQANRQPVYEAGARAVVLLAMAGSLRLEDRLKAGEITQAIEKMDPHVHVDTARYCQRRLEAWIRAGEVTKDMVAKAYTQSQQLLDNVFSANGESNEDD